MTTNTVALRYPLHRPPQQRRASRSGLTLLELLAVLMILAITATVAVTATDGLLQQSRYESTRQGLDSLTDAVLGTPNQRQPDGTTIINGFVADIGRPPRAFGADVLSQLAELWSNDKDGDGTADLAPFALRSPTIPTVDPEVAVPCGWRGPYLRLPVGTGVLRDGWGNEIELYTEDGAVCSPGDMIAIGWSRGSDNAVGGNGYEADMHFVFRANAGAVSTGVAPEIVDLYSSTVQGNVRFADSMPELQAAGVGVGDTVSIRVVLYGPDPSTGGLLPTYRALPYSAIVEQDIDGNLTIPDFAYEALATTIGHRVIRAYLYRENPPVEPPLLKSNIAERVVPAGGEKVDLFFD